jgi:hypothetical protein
MDEVKDKSITITKKEGLQASFKTRNPLIFMVDQDRIELSTLGFSVRPGQKNTKIQPLD